MNTSPRISGEYWTIKRFGASSAKAQTRGRGESGSYVLKVMIFRRITTERTSSRANTSWSALTGVPRSSVPSRRRFEHLSLTGTATLAKCAVSPRVRFIHSTGGQLAFTSATLLTNRTVARTSRRTFARCARCAMKVRLISLHRGLQRCSY